MKLTPAAAHALAVAALAGLGFAPDDARVTADHLVDCGLRGLTYGSLARVLTIAERLPDFAGRLRPIEILRESPASAALDGGFHVGYVVAHRATTLAIEKAAANGIAAVGANNTWLTGMFSYYVEMAARAGLVGMAAGNSPAIVAPFGAMEARLGTNPLAFGFPSADGDPVIWDIGTAAIMQGEIDLHRRLGTLLPEGVAIDGEGRPTRDPVAANQGAVRAWGGHRGSGLSVAVQLLGAMAGTAAIPDGTGQFAGYLFVAMRPDLFIDGESFPSVVAALRREVRGAAPEPGAGPVRMPFDRSAAMRRAALAADAIEVPDEVKAGLERLAALSPA